MLLETELTELGDELYRITLEEKYQKVFGDKYYKDGWIKRCRHCGNDCNRYIGKLYNRYNPQ
jgi:hypothetical protein